MARGRTDIKPPETLVLTSGLSTELTVDAAKFVPQGIGNRATVEGDLQLGLADGKLSGAIDTTVTVPNLVEGHFDGDFGE